MCGIAGVISQKNIINPINIKKMLDTIKHRGPDDEGFYFFDYDNDRFAYGIDTVDSIKKIIDSSVESLKGNFLGALGHRRLSIIDTSASGHQPMQFSDVTITFNGEIYNYIEVREKLQKKGIVFETEGDTEVIIKAYIYWGEDCVKYFNGMWAFAIWDKKNKKLFCSRDRLGEKPFYYHSSENTFVFGSEIKQLLEYGVKAKSNDKNVFSFLYYGIHNHNEQTFFEDILSLPGGYNLIVEFDNNKESLIINKYRYWNLNTKTQELKCSFEEATKLIGEKIEESIKLRLRSDVEIGSCLSGGLDSSTIVSLACKKMNMSDTEIASFKTFTSCYDNADEIDERYFSRQIVEYSKCSNIEIKPDSDKLINDFSKLVWHQEEPFGSLSIFAGWCVMQKAHENGVKVLLDGQGGDEALFGYERYYSYGLKKILLEGKIKKLVKEFYLSSKNSRLKLTELIAYTFYFNNPRIRKKRLNLKTSKFLNKEFMSIYEDMDLVNDMLYFESAEDLQYNELTRTIVPLLRYEDKNSMAYSIEARVPFLDYTFIESAISIPIKYKLKDGWTKAILRNYMKDNMPYEVAYRKNKLGFNVPQKKWLDETNDFFKENLLSNPRSSRYFNMDYINEIFSKNKDQDTRFKFIMIETWMRVFDIT